jgi:LiaF transmembrane domain
MKTSHVFWGTLFISFGLLVLINNFTSILMDWSLIWKLWPLVIILIGVSIVIKHKAGKSFVAGIAALILAFAIFGTFKTAFYIADNDFEISLGGKPGFAVNEYTETYDESIKSATLNFDGGAGKFILQDTSSSLIYFRTEGAKDNYRLTRIDNDNESKIDFEMKDAKIIFGKNYKNRVDLNLNSSPIWNINFDVGAASMDLDLKKFKVKDVTVDMGAASLELTVSSLLDTTNISIDAGASDININIPEDAGCEITTDAALSSKHFPGFDETGSGHYRSSNYDESKQKVFIDIDCGVSSISVTRY